MNGKVLLLLGGAGLVYLATRAKAIKETVEFLEYTPRGIELKFEGLVPVLYIKLDIYNPNRSSVPVNGFVGRVFYKGSPVANITHTDRININGNMNSSLTLKVRLSLYNAVVSLLAKDPNKAISIDGLIKTPITDLPVKFSYDFVTKAFSRSVAILGRTSFHSRMMARARKKKGIQRRFIDAFKIKQAPVYDELPAEIENDLAA